MNSKQLKDVIKQIESLKTPESSADFQAGVDVAINIVNGVIQEALDRERMQKLEEELAELRSKYATSDDIPKKRGRKPKAVESPDKALHGVE